MTKIKKLVIKDLRGKYKTSDFSNYSFVKTKEATEQVEIDIKAILMLPIQEYYSDLETKGYSTIPTKDVIQAALALHKIQTAEANAKAAAEAESFLNKG
jgi:hypothetical protein